MDETMPAASRLDLRESDEAPVPVSSITPGDGGAPGDSGAGDRGRGEGSTASDPCGAPASPKDGSEACHAVEEGARTRSASALVALVVGADALAAGTPLVHLEHGVGRNGGLQRVELDGRERELLAIDYADGERVYVPLDALHLVSRHGLDDAEAPLHAVDDPDWSARRREAAEQARDVARAVLDRHARRADADCRPVEVDPGRLERFAAGFGHEPTGDQRAAIEAVLADMARPRPMDRVVCGDVGFGKTEVALRAAFAAVDAGRQVAVFAPTTVLARQHHARFVERFAAFPARIGSLTRLDAAETTATTLAAMRAGELDIVVGTHALLCDDASFADLGLVVVDEEQRFGAEQKRCIEAIGDGVHLLTLSATPIPRTVGTCLAGLRELSLVTTPPPGRRAVETVVGPLDDERVGAALEREVARGGQAFAVHNAVRSIDAFAQRLRALVPRADIRVAHAQLPEETLAELVDDFAAHRFDVLVATTIIENGVDIPNANTLVVDRADELGLAQLHQLRGRVGRTDRAAYALFLTPDRESLGEAARGRLRAFETSDGLGAGPELAIRDLCLRGGGELLGDAQSGELGQVGFALYTTLLGQAMRDRANGRELDPDRPFGHRVEIVLVPPPTLSAAQVPDPDERLRYALRLAHAAGGAPLESVVRELRERHGPLPAESARFVDVLRLRRRAESLGVERITVDAASVRVTFDPASARGAGDMLDALVGERDGRCRLDGNEIVSRRPPPNEAAGLRLVREILDALEG